MANDEDIVKIWAKLSDLEGRITLIEKWIHQVNEGAKKL